jgi:hypothetical protein
MSMKDIVNRALPLHQKEGQGQRGKELLSPRLLLLLVLLNGRFSLSYPYCSVLGASFPFLLLLPCGSAPSEEIIFLS